MSCFCPVCEAPALAQSFIARCASCGHRWLPTSTQTRRAIESTMYVGTYAGYAEDPVFAASIRDLVNTTIAPRVSAGASVLDVGCGAGEFLMAAKEAGLCETGIDISPDAAKLCRSRGLNAFSGDFLTHPFPGAFDVITMWDVMEHLREPAAFLNRARGLLRPGGIFIAKVPAFGEISVTVSDAVPRFASALLGAPDHVQFYSARSFSALLSRAGMTPDTVEWRRRGLRQPDRGGSVRKRAGRAAKRVIKASSGDGNILAIAKHS